MKSILIQIFGIKDSPASSACSCSHDSCSNSKNSCTSCSSSNCKNTSGVSSPQNIFDIFRETLDYLKKSNVGAYIDVQFIDIDSLEDITSNEEIQLLLENGYEPPITVIDGIIRYHGGIRASLIYNDIKELLEDYYGVTL